MKRSSPQEQNLRETEPKLRKVKIISSSESPVVGFFGEYLGNVQASTSKQPLASNLNQEAQSYQNMKKGMQDFLCTLQKGYSIKSGLLHDAEHELRNTDPQQFQRQAQQFLNQLQSNLVEIASNSPHSQSKLAGDLASQSEAQQYRQVEQSNKSLINEEEQQLNFQSSSKNQFSSIQLQRNDLKGQKKQKSQKGQSNQLNQHQSQGQKSQKGQKGKNEKVLRGLQGQKGQHDFKWEKGQRGQKGQKCDNAERRIKGQRGQKGQKGDNGEQGMKGQRGQKGQKGQKGDSGEQGSKGQRGQKGQKGQKGDNGERGMKGQRGQKGEKGQCHCSKEQIEKITKTLALQAISEQLKKKEDTANQKIGWAGRVKNIFTGPKPHEKSKSLEKQSAQSNQKNVKKGFDVVQPFSLSFAGSINPNRGLFNLNPYITNSPPSDRQKKNSQDISFAQTTKNQIVPNYFIPRENNAFKPSQEQNNINTSPINTQRFTEQPVNSRRPFQSPISLPLQQIQQRRNQIQQNLVRWSYRPIRQINQWYNNLCAMNFSSYFKIIGFAIVLMLVHERSWSSGANFAIKSLTQNMQIQEIIKKIPYLAQLFGKQVIKRFG